MLSRVPAWDALTIPRATVASNNSFFIHKSDAEREISFNGTHKVSRIFLE